MTYDIARRLDRYIEELTRRLPPYVQSAMWQVVGAQCRLLALRRYLQVLAEGGPERLRQRWAWTRDEFNSSARGRGLIAEATAVIRRFNADNPGHHLSHADPAWHRTVEDQVSLWNRNATAQRIGDQLRSLATAELQRTVTTPVTPPYLQPQQSLAAQRQSVTPPTVGAKRPVYPSLGPVSSPPYLQAGPKSPSVQQTMAVPRALMVYEELPTDRASLDRFREFLVRPNLPGLAPTTNAPPGLSRHGWAGAVDFTIPDLELGPGNPGRWRSTGMAQRLQDAVRSAGQAAMHLEGPLRVPDEPWHYNYNP